MATENRTHSQGLAPDATATHLCSQFQFLIFHTHALPVIGYFRNWDKKLVGIISIDSLCVGSLREKIHRKWLLLWARTLQEEGGNQYLARSERWVNSGERRPRPDPLGC